MPDRHHLWPIDGAIRAGGATCWVVAYFAVKGLGPMNAAVHQMVLAAIAFLCGSFGAAMMWLGHHILDRIEVSDQWRRRRRAPPVERGF